MRRRSRERPTRSSERTSSAGRASSPDRAATARASTDAPGRGSRTGTGRAPRGLARAGGGAWPRIGSVRVRRRQDRDRDRSGHGDRTRDRSAARRARRAGRRRRAAARRPARDGCGDRCARRRGGRRRCRRLRSRGHRGGGRARRATPSATPTSSSTTRPSTRSGRGTRPTPREWDAVFATNVRGYFLMARAVRSADAGQRGGGAIVNVASVTFFTGEAGLVSYVASKGAVIGFTRALAREAGPEGIRVNAVAPGAFPTAATEIHADQDALWQRRARVAVDQAPRRGGGRRPGDRLLRRRRQRLRDRPDAAGRRRLDAQLSGNGLDARATPRSRGSQRCSTDARLLAADASPA